MHDSLAQTAMELISNEWQTLETDLTLSKCFHFVKFKMNVNRDMCIIADTTQRREFCVALYEYTHRVVSLSDSDAAFVEQYEGSQRHYTQSRSKPVGENATTLRA